MKDLRLALLAGVFATLGISSTSAQTFYNGDLIVGFTAETGTDLLYDLADPFSLTNNQSWNLAAPLSSFDITTVKWGVVGDSIDNGAYIQWVTKSPGGSLPAVVPNEASWNIIDNAIAGMYQLFPAAGPGQSIMPDSTTQNSWNQQTVNGSLTTQYHNIYMNPNVIGVGQAALYKVLDDRSAPQLVGAFSLSAEGVLTYSKGSVYSPPPAPSLAIARMNGATTISFGTTNGATYTLFFTNTAGLSVPVSSWPSSATTIIGDGSIKSFTDNTSDPQRVYRVGAR